MTITIEPYEWAGDLAAEDLAAATASFNAAWAEWVPGSRPMSAAAFVDHDRFTAPPERIMRMLARDDRGVLVAHGRLQWRAGPGGCSLQLMVHPDARGGGAGRTLGLALVEAARDAGRSGVTVEAAEDSLGDEVCRRAGLRADLLVEANQTATASIDRALLESWRARGEQASGYSLVAYDAPVPSDALAADFVHARHVMNDAPSYEGEPDHTYTVDELRAVEEASAAAHQAWWNVGVRHEGTGELVGLSELHLPAGRPWIALQGDTGVDPAHRGHGLGAWMKAINHLRLAADRPAVEVVHTWNAASNEPMLRINRALGFRPVRRFQAWWLPFS